MKLLADIPALILIGVPLIAVAFQALRAALGHAAAPKQSAPKPAKQPREPKQQTEKQPRKPKQQTEKQPRKKKEQEIVHLDIPFEEFYADAEVEICAERMTARGFTQGTVVKTDDEGWIGVNVEHDETGETKNVKLYPKDILSVVDIEGFKLERYDGLRDGAPDYLLEQPED